MKSLSWFVLILLLSSFASADDWPRFRGPGGNGDASGEKIPSEFGDTTNLKWKTKLPGAGSSSPIVIGERVFVTCYSGKGSSLKRQLVSVDRKTGTVQWTKIVDAVQPEDAYRGYLTEHGYASNTPVANAKLVFAFHSKSGVYAYDHTGQELWRKTVGTRSSNRRWGSAASLILYKDLVIVNAADEGRAIYAFDQKTGEEKWRFDAASLELAFGTPTLVKVSDERTDLAIAVPGEVWGINPDTGKLTWRCNTKLTGNVSPTIVSGGNVVYAFGGYRSSGSQAIRVGGEGDVTDTHTVWSGRNSSYVATPLLYDGHLYWVDDRGQAFCINAETGEQDYRERLEGLSSGGRPVYASPVKIGENIVVVSRTSGVFVIAADLEFKVIAHNKFASDDSQFNGTPAVSNGEMFLRSDQFLYCVGE